MNAAARAVIGTWLVGFAIGTLFGASLIEGDSIGIAIAVVATVAAFAFAIWTALGFHEVKR
jgi:hypothetical protein